MIYEKILKKSANLGHAISQTSLGGLYFHGQLTEKNLEKAANQERAFIQNKLGMEQQRI